MSAMIYGRAAGTPFGWTRPRGLVAERLRRGLQILLTRFDSGRGLQKTLYDPRWEDKFLSVSFRSPSYLALARDAERQTMGIFTIAIAVALIAGFIYLSMKR